MDLRPTEPGGKSGKNVAPKTELPNFFGLNQ